MPRYIDADELIFIGLDNPDDDHLFEFVPKEFIDNAPTADVVEVVRCKDCKWFDSQNDFCHNPRWGNGWANYPPPTVIEERFCCDGERREDAEVH